MMGDPQFGEFTRQAPAEYLSRRALAACAARRRNALQLNLILPVWRTGELDDARRRLLALLGQRPARPDDYPPTAPLVERGDDDAPPTAAAGATGGGAAAAGWAWARLVCERRGGRLRLRFEGDPHAPPLHVAGPRSRRLGARYVAAELRLVEVPGRAPYWRAARVFEVSR